LQDLRVFNKLPESLRQLVDRILHQKLAEVQVMLSAADFGRPWQQ